MNHCKKNEKCKECRFYLLCKDDLLDFNMLNDIDELRKSTEFINLKNKSISRTKKIVIMERYQKLKI